MSDWFRVCPIEERLYQITDVAGTHFFLLLGEREAMLLDTGVGCGDLRKLVRELTPLPVKVLVTHGHVDHAMGAAEFDTVYMNHEDDTIYVQHSDEKFREDGLFLCPQKDQIEEGEIIPALPLDAIHDMKEGDSFDLGGVHIDVYACPGHTRGILVMLIREERTILLGDACNDRTFLFDEFAASVPDYRAALMTLDAQTAGQYDRVLLSHEDGEGVPDMLRRVIEVCDDMLAGRSDAQPFEFLGDCALLARACGPDGARLDGGRGNVVYRLPLQI